MTNSNKPAEFMFIEQQVTNPDTVSDCQGGAGGKLKRPRGRPPVGAILTDEGKYVLPVAAIEAAAERVIRHRTACRERYVATRKGLRVAKPELFSHRRISTNQRLSSPSIKKDDERQGTR